MRKLLFLLLVIFFTSCEDKYLYDGRILTDTKTGERFILDYRIGDCFFVKPETAKIIGDDTTYVFR